MPEALQAVTHVGGRGSGCLRAREHDDIERRDLVLRETERFARESLESIAINGVADGLARDSEPETRMCKFVGSSEHCEQVVGNSQIVFEHTREIFVPAETCASWQKMAGSRGALDSAHGELRA